MRIELKLYAVGTLDVNSPGNVQGDEVVARAWVKYLLRRPEIHSVKLAHETYPGLNQDPGSEFCIYFYPFTEVTPGPHNILYLQNAFPPAHYQGGTKGVFDAVRDHYCGYMFTSERLRDTCAPGAVIPFATDPEVFFPVAPTSHYTHQVVIVGNNIRGPEVNDRYFRPARPYLTIYGNPWEGEYAACCRGKIPMGDLPALYSSAQICLNAHIAEHIVYDTTNFRIFNILACGGFIITDRTPTLERDFATAVVFTDGGDQTTTLIEHYLNHPQETIPYRQQGRQLVIEHHTWAQRIDDLMAYLNCLTGF